MPDKKKIVLISDHPLVPSGVGTQARYLIEGLWKTGKYRFVCLGGAIQHVDMRPQKVEPDVYGDDWIVRPVIGYGDKQVLRQTLLMEKPDAIIFVTDPRFYVWLWEMEDEIRQVCPLIYWHVWDNDPIPKFNKIFYDSTDHISAISLKTKGILDALDYKNSSYIPHGVDPNIFRPLPEEDVQKFKRDFFGPHVDKKFVLFWNNRNARRKVTGDVVATFAKFANEVGRKNVVLAMHTAVHDPEGQDILALAQEFKIDSELIISERRLDPDSMNMYYNVADCTINLASNEGFGLSTLESLYAGTPIVAHFTGGLQFQIGDWWQTPNGELDVNIKDQEAMTSRARKLWNMRRGKWWGVPVFSASRSCTGSQQVPFIYDDRVAHEDVVIALKNIYEMGRVQRKLLGAEAREWAMKTFPLTKMVNEFDRVISETIERHDREPRVRTATI